MKALHWYINDNNAYYQFENYLGQMYPVYREIKDTIERDTHASYLDLVD